MTKTKRFGTDLLVFLIFRSELNIPNSQTHHIYEGGTGYGPTTLNPSARHRARVHYKGGKYTLSFLTFSYLL